MDMPESKVHSFIVKLLLEEAGDESGKAVWHGYITHVPSGERRYLRRLSDVTEFIEQYLEGFRFEQEPKSRFRSWLSHLNSGPTRRL